MHKACLHSIMFHIDVYIFCLLTIPLSVSAKNSFRPKAGWIVSQLKGENKKQKFEISVFLFHFCNGFWTQTDRKSPTDP